MPRDKLAPPAPAIVALARQRYCEGRPVHEILGEANISLATLYGILDGRHDDGSGSAPAPLARRRKFLAPRKRMPRQERVSLVSRLWRAAERQVRDIEMRLAAVAPEAGDRERDARLLAVLVKTLRELHAFDGDNLRGKSQAELEHDDEIRDIDEYRRELARKIDQLAAKHSAGGDRGSVAG